MDAIAYNQIFHHPSGSQWLVYTAKHRSTSCIDKYLSCLSIWSDILAVYTSPEIVSLKFSGCLVYAYIEGLLPVSAVGWDNQYVWELAFSRLKSDQYTVP